MLTLLHHCGRNLVTFRTFQAVNRSYYSTQMGKRVAVVLAGCGVYDGSEIHEASAVLVHLSRGGASVNMFAPNIDQMHVVNHLKGEPSEEKRNVLVESARLARGNIQDLSKLSVKDHDAIIFPGGFGAAKNLCTWAVQGKDCSVNDEVKAALQAFHGEGKPIGLCCISPVLAAKVFPGCEITLGLEKDEKYPYTTDSVAGVSELGCKHVNKNVSESHVDEKNKLVTTCAFMCEAPIHEIFDGIGEMVKDVLKLA
ncbi:glutamine amidotransferase-like class 1 domain-containing protein 3A, mitochondrial [Sphaeramia orbicularis]|uniref:Glutamine amidotransferase-like class 1 domain-containing protein 3A, mitochondrial n=1 Tax=Sphaeramia orbicularis TaxID=375764 RepID=A0A673CWY9_9TELE|nr:glutamine amidotransferase-like class 1 domain-containing protein 3A, mitochondrial [Sphaeramia orbicularis]